MARSLYGYPVHSNLRAARVGPYPLRLTAWRWAVDSRSTDRDQGQSVNMPETTCNSPNLRPCKQSCTPAVFAFPGARRKGEHTADLYHAACKKCEGCAIRSDARGGT